MAMFGTDVWNLLERGAGREHAHGQTPDGPGGPEAAASVSRFISLSPLPAGRAPARCARACFPLRCPRCSRRLSGRKGQPGPGSVRLLRARRQRRLPLRKRQEAQGKPGFREALSGLSAAQAGGAALSCPPCPSLFLLPSRHRHASQTSSGPWAGCHHNRLPAPPWPLPTAHSGGVSAPLAPPLFPAAPAQRGHRQPGLVQVAGVTTPIAPIRLSASFPWPEEGEPIVTPFHR